MLLTKTMSGGTQGGTKTMPFYTVRQQSLPLLLISLQMFEGVQNSVTLGVSSKLMIVVITDLPYVKCFTATTWWLNSLVFVSPCMYTVPMEFYV